MHLVILYTYRHDVSGICVHIYDIFFIIIFILLGLYYSLSGFRLSVFLFRFIATGFLAGMVLDRFSVKLMVSTVGEIHIYNDCTRTHWPYSILIHTWDIVYGSRIVLSICISACLRPNYIYIYAYWSAKSYTIYIYMCVHTHSFMLDSSVGRTATAEFNLVFKPLVCCFYSLVFSQYRYICVCILNAYVYQWIWRNFWNVHWTLGRDGDCELLFGRRWILSKAASPSMDTVKTMR